MATVALVQSTTASSTSATTLTATLGSVPGSGHFVVAVIAAGAAIQSLSNAGSILLDAGSPTNPVLQMYKWTGDGIGLKSLTVNLVSAAPVSIFYFELPAIVVSLLTVDAGTTVTVPTITAGLPTNWLPTVGDLPLAFFTALPASTATAQTGWTNLATLNTGGNVLNAQSGPTATSAGQGYTGKVTWSATNPAGEGIILAANQGFYDFTSQMYTETIGSDTALARSSQEIAEVVGQDTANAHISQALVEHISQDTALSRTSQIYIELVVPLYERTSQMYLETVGSDTAKIHTSQMLVEVLFSSQGQRRRVVEDELFTY